MIIKKEQSSFWVYSRKNWKHGPEEMFACTCSKEHYSQQTPGGSTPSAHWGWMDKENEVYIYSGILFSLKKKEILSHASTWMSFEKIMLREISHSYKKTNTDSPYMQCLKVVKFIKTERWLPGIGTGEKEGWQSLSFARWQSSWDLFQNNMNIPNTTKLYN